MTAKQLPPPELLRQLLRYEPETGKLFWRERRVKLFNDSQNRSAKHSCAQWNSRNANKEAFTADDGKGYRSGLIFGKNYSAHRVIWALHYGAYPSGDIDHINGVRDDNRIENLRVVTHQENCKNRKVRSDSRSGHTGVYFCRKNKHWKASIQAMGKSLFLGTFSNVKDAVSARKEAEAKYGFHPNHGRS